MFDIKATWVINLVPKMFISLSNFKFDELELYSAAVETYNRECRRYDVFIDRDAYWDGGIYDPSRYALRSTDEHGNYADFWDIFDRLKKEFKQRNE